MHWDVVAEGTGWDEYIDTVHRQIPPIKAATGLAGALDRSRFGLPFHQRCRIPLSYYKIPNFTDFKIPDEI
jgi:hypothetical protein